MILFRFIHVLIYWCLSTEGLQLSHHSCGGLLALLLPHPAGNRRYWCCLKLTQPPPLFPQDAVNILVSFVLLVNGRQQTGSGASTLRGAQVAALLAAISGVVGCARRVSVALLSYSLLPSHLASPLLGCCHAWLLYSPCKKVSMAWIYLLLMPQSHAT